MDLTHSVDQPATATPPWHEILPVVPQRASRELAEWLIDVQAATWPAGLYRHALFRRLRDGDAKRYRAVAWNPATRELHVLEMSPKISLKGAGRWHTWSLETEPRALHDIQLVTFQSPIKKVTEASKKNVLKHKALLRALLRVTHDVPQWNDREPINDAVLMSKTALQESVLAICRALGKSPSYQKTLKLLLHRYFYFGGTDEAYLSLTPLRGGRGKERTGKNTKKPGRRNASERASANRAAVEGNREAEQQAPVRDIDLRKMLLALRRWYVGARYTLVQTYQHMVVEMYANLSKFATPTLPTFRYHARKLIAQYDLNRLRNGERLHTMYDAARIGRATDPTGGVIEILDVDGFKAKVYIKHPNGRRKTPFEIWVIFAVSRLSSAVLGYSLSLTRENARAYRECLASVHRPKSGPGSRAAELGLENMVGLLHGNYDEIYVDHGPGSAKSVSAAVVDRLRLARSIPPPRRPELRAIGESLNRLILEFCTSAASGYRRANDQLSKEKRQAAKKARPLTVDQFERLLLRAINHINLYYAKRRKLTHGIRTKGGKPTPQRLFEATQKGRIADASREMSSEEVWEMYSDWKWKTCERGTVEEAGLTYTSRELGGFFDERRPFAGGKPIRVQVQQVGDPHFLQWRKSDGELRTLTVTKEDERRLEDGMNWFQWEMVQEADRVDEADRTRKAAEDRVAADAEQQEIADVGEAAPKRRSHNAEVTASQQGMLEEAWANRSPPGGLTESTAPTPEGSAGEGTKKDAGSTRKASRKKASENQESARELGWVAEVDVTCEEGLADLM